MKKMIRILFIAFSFIVGSISTGILANGIMENNSDPLQGRPTSIIVFHPRETGDNFGITNVQYSGSITSGNPNFSNIVMPQNGMIGHLVAYSSSAPPSSIIYKITIMKNGVDTSLSCSIDNTNESCNDMNNIVNINAIDKIVARIDAQGLSPDSVINQNVNISVAYTAR